jgi:O-antigen/teichoic acid export membrane protein
MILLSRMLSPVEFGISVALTSVLGVASMLSDVGLDRFVLLKREEDSGRALAAAHVIQIVCGAVIALGLILLAGPMAALFNVPQAMQGFMAIGAVPWIRSFAHLGPKQAQRDYDFRSNAIANLAASAFSLIATVPAVWIAPNHNAIIISLVVSEFVYVATTHILSRRRFQLAWDRRTLEEGLRYGLPLMFNGIGLAIFAQADRILVGSFFGVETLGSYAVIVSIALVAMSPFYAICSSLCLSIVARNRANFRRFANLFRAATWSFGLFAFGYCAFVGLTLDYIVPWVFGSRHVVEPDIRLTLAFIAAIRILRGPATVLLLVDGRTSRLTMANLLAGVGLAFAFVSVRAFPTLEAILLGILVGDLLSFGLFQRFLIMQIPSFGSRLTVIPVTISVAALGLLSALASPLGASLGGRASIALICGLVFAALAGRVLAAAKLADAV